MEESKDTPALALAEAMEVEVVEHQGERTPGNFYKNKAPTRGGARKGAGRPPGSVDVKKGAIVAEALAKGKTPIEHMLEVMRSNPPEKGDKESPEEFAKRMEKWQARVDSMAVAAAPYCHPKLASIEHSGNVEVRHELALAELE